MRRNILLAVAVLAIFSSQASISLCAAPPAGNAVATIQGSVTVCVVPNTMSPLPCTAKGAEAVEASVSELGRVVWDASGNACMASTETISAPGTTVTIRTAVTFVGKMGSYDPVTQTGTATVTGYVDASCAGSVANITNATQRSKSNVRFLISQGGTRIDGVVTSIKFPSVELGAVSLSGTALKQ